MGDFDGPRRTVRRLCITVFDYNEPNRDGVPRIHALIDWIKQHCRYGVLGKEVCPDTGRRHLQGYMGLSKVWKARSVLESIRTLLDLRAEDPGPSCGPRSCFHIEIAHGTEAQNREYCIKEGHYYEHGQPQGQGRRNDIQEAFKRLREADAWEEILDGEEVQTCLAKYPNWCRMQWRRGKELAVREAAVHLDYHPWQLELLEVLEADPPPRKIYFIVGGGGTGKSTFARHLLLTRSDTELWTRGAKSTDIAHAITGHRVQLFDISRAEEEPDYGLLEDVKNGVIFSGKYLPERKIFPIPHVFVFMNVPPDFHKMSEDRFEIINL